MTFGPPPKPFNLSLRQTTPSAFDVSDLRTQMENIGLNCSALTDAALEGYITTVRAGMPSVTLESWGIMEASDPETVSSVATGHWTTTNNAQGYDTILSSLVYPEYFDWLFQDAQSYSFPGVKKAVPSTTQLLPNATALTQFFVDTADAASSTMVTGINKDDLSAAFTNVIKGVDPSMKDYDSGKQNRIIYMVDDYDPHTKTSAGIGAVRIDWHLTIADYKRKDKDGGDTHKVTIDLTARGVFYTDLTVCDNYSTIYKQFQTGFHNAKQKCPPSTEND